MGRLIDPTHARTIRTSLCGVRSDSEHSLCGVEKVAGMVEGVKPNHIGTCHALRVYERVCVCERMCVYACVCKRVCVRGFVRERVCAVCVVCAEGGRRGEYQRIEDRWG